MVYTFYTTCDEKTLKSLSRKARTSVFVTYHSCLLCGGGSGGQRKEGAAKNGWETEDGSHEHTERGGCVPDRERGQ